MRCFIDLPGCIGHALNDRLYRGGEGVQSLGEAAQRVVTPCFQSGFQVAAGQDAFDPGGDTPDFGVDAGNQYQQEIQGIKRCQQ